MSTNSPFVLKTNEIQFNSNNERKIININHITFNLKVTEKPGFIKIIINKFLGLRDFCDPDSDTLTSWLV